MAIKQVEVSIVDRAWEEGWILPLPPQERTGRRVSVIGSGPAGLAAAQQLTRAGHDVVVSRANLGRNNRFRLHNGNENVSPDLRAPGEYLPPTSLRRLIIRDGRTKPEVI